MIDDIKLSELISVKICHDLAGPVGAVSNGVELLKDFDADIKEKSIELVEGSAKDAVARILYFRHAFGTVNSGSDITLETIKNLSENVFKSKNIKFIWSVGDKEGLSFKDGFGKLVLNMVQTVSDCLMKGGDVSVNIEKKSSNYRVTITAKGEYVKVPIDISAILGKEEVTLYDVNLKNVVQYLVINLAESMGMKVKLYSGDGSVELVAA